MKEIRPSSPRRLVSEGAAKEASDREKNKIKLVCVSQANQAQATSQYWQASKQVSEREKRPFSELCGVRKPFRKSPA